MNRSPQLNKIYNIMKDGRWRKLKTIAEMSGDPQHCVSARLRDLRKEIFGGHVVERKSADNRKGGLFKYRLILRTINDIHIPKRKAIKKNTQKNDAACYTGDLFEF